MDSGQAADDEAEFSKFEPEKRRYQLFTMAEARHLLYNLGLNAVDRNRSKGNTIFLRAWAARRWNLLFKPKVHKQLTIRIPGGRYKVGDTEAAMN